MSEPDESDSVLKRWSRRKHAAQARAHAAGEQVAPAAPAKSEADSLPLAARPVETKAVVVDPASLPPIDSITAANDIRAFLAPGVPPEITRAALRRAWLTDPTIRDFIGLAENQWDFTTPDGVPGFGSLDLTPQLRQSIARLVGDGPAEVSDKPISKIGSGSAAQAPEKPTEWPPMIANTDSGVNKVQRSTAPEQLMPETPRQPGAASDQTISADAAAQPIPIEDATRSSRPAQRRHGGALPR